MWPRSDRLNIRSVLLATGKLHSEIIHLIVESENELSVTIPAVHGTEKVVGLIGAFLSASLNASRSGSLTGLEGLRAEWPEYVLWPDHLIAFFEDECRSPILEIPE